MTKIHIASIRKQSPLVQQYLQAALSENTRRAYENDLNHFIEWGGRIPATPQRVALYLASHAEKLSFATLARRVVAISRAHQVQNLPSPAHSDVVKSTLHGIRRVNGSTQRRVAPALLSEVQRMVKALQGIKGLRDRTLLLVGFAGAFRRSELVSISVEDIAFVNEGMVIRLRRGKTDQGGIGREVAMPFMSAKYCPVKSMREWLERSGINTGAVFRRVDRNGKLTGDRLTGQSVALILKLCAKSVGLDEKNYSGHSLRAGWVTSAAKSGASSWKICQHTGHQSDAVMHRYIRDSNLFNNHPLNNI